jgi:hypothetical protein
VPPNLHTSLARKRPDLDTDDEDDEGR